MNSILVVVNNLFKCNFKKYIYIETFVFDFTAGIQKNNDLLLYRKLGLFTWYRNTNRNEIC